MPAALFGRPVMFDVPRDAIRPTSQTLRGVGQADVRIHGLGDIHIRMPDPEGHMTEITLRDVAYVPASPFNLISVAKAMDANMSVDFSLGCFNAPARWDTGGQA